MTRKEKDNLLLLKIALCARYPELLYQGVDLSFDKDKVLIIKLKYPGKYTAEEVNELAYNVIHENDSKP